MDIIGAFQAIFSGGVDVINIVVYNAIIVFVLFVVYKLLTKFISKAVFTAARTKKERSNAVIFLHLWRYMFIVFAILILIFAYSGSFEYLGLSAALLTAALGWALQRPISGIAAWVMVIISKPFRIGDRIIIGGIKGDVVDLSLTHVYISEIGGTIGSDERSGRVIMVPNSLLFENNIINYTFVDEFVMDEVACKVTYSSDIDAAKKIWFKSAADVTKDFGHKAGTPTVRTYFSDDGITVTVRYKTRADDRERAKSDITEKIYKQVARTRNVRFAYPHREIIVKNGNRSVRAK